MRKHVKPDVNPLASTAQLPKATLSGILPRKLELAHLLMGQSNALKTNILSSSHSEFATATGIVSKAHGSGEGRAILLNRLGGRPTQCRNAIPVDLSLVSFNCLSILDCGKDKNDSKGYVDVVRRSSLEVAFRDVGALFVGLQEARTP